MADSDRRRHPRHLLRVEGRLIIPGPHHPLVIVDFSEGGIGLEAPQSLAPETRVAVEIGDPQGECFTFRGKVAWCVQDRSGGLPVYRMGICTDMIASRDQTAVLPDEKTAMIERIVAFFDPRQSSATMP